MDARRNDVGGWDRPDVPAVDKGASARRPARGVVKARAGKWGMGPETVGQLLDVSETGVGLAWPKSIAVGEEIELEVAGLHSRDSFKVRAVVDSAERGPSGQWTINCSFEKHISYDKVSKLAR